MAFVTYEITLDTLLMALILVDMKYNQARIMEELELVNRSLLGAMVRFWR